MTNMGGFTGWVWRGATLLLLVFQLSACGGGGGSSNAPQQPAPSGLTYTSPVVLAVGSPMTALSPTVTGTVTSYTISPDLPAGLAFDVKSGAISGTPTAVRVTSTYTVTASNPSGSTTFAISITVNDQPPSISYGTTRLSFTAGTPVAALTPTNTGGAVVSWSLDVPLPTGLTFNSIDGSISGTPAANSAPAAFVITAANSGGQRSIRLTISVGSVLLELGHASRIVSLQTTGTTVASLDASGQQVVWNYATGATLASGQAESNLVLAGAIATEQSGTGIVVRRTVDWHQLSAISGSFSWVKAASDGSYLCAGNSSGLKAWSPAGVELLNQPGDYSNADAFAAVDAIQVARGAAGQDVVETISLADGSTTVSPPFQGIFHSWFSDGERFLSILGTTVWTYSKLGTQQDARVLPNISNLAGYGNWFWVTPNTATLEIYAVGASATPTATLSFANGSTYLHRGSTIGVYPIGEGRVSVIDLDAATPVQVDHVLPIAYLSAYAAVSKSLWLVGNEHGVLLDGQSLASTLRYLSLGAALSIAGSDTRIAVATAAGTLFYFDAHTLAQEGALPSFASMLALSSDGSVLAAGVDLEVDHQFRDDVTIRTISLPAGTEIHAWPYRFSSSPRPVDLTLSASGTAIGQVTIPNTANSTYARQVTDITGSTTLWSDTVVPPNAIGIGWPPIRLSPDGSRIAVSNDIPSVDVVTNIFNNGSLVTAVPGFNIGWIDDGRFLVQTYKKEPHLSLTLDSSVIYGSSGTKLATVALPELKNIQTAGPDAVYSRELNSIFSLTTGAAMWSSAKPTTGVGALAGSNVVFGSGTRVVVEPY